LGGLRLLTGRADLRFQRPDLRLAWGTVLLIVWMTVGWIRSTRRNTSNA